VHRTDHRGDRARSRDARRRDCRRLHRRRPRRRAERDRHRLNLDRLAFAALYAGAISVAAWRVNALTRSGALAAFVVGFVTYAVADWRSTAVLLAFFLSSVGLSRLGRARKKQLVDVGKSGARDAWQVVANGGVATLALAIFASERFGARAEVPLLAAFAGAYAAATADTWGTEIGTLARGVPRSILSLRRIATGLSGGVTIAGTLAEAAGAVAIAAIAAGVLGVSPLSVALGGMAGALVDSVLGATLQELRSCPACGRTCETNPHVCGTATTLVRGVRGFSNDLVNFCATLAGAAIAFTIAAVFRI
jgi:uncharacterized protein (TIGR00297 family)